MLSILLAVALSQSPQAPHPPQAPERMAAPLTYAECRARAITEGKPLVCFVGSALCPACAHTLASEAVCHTCATFPDVPASGGIVVAVPEGGELLRVADVTQWITSDPTWGHVPSVRRALSNWRTRRQVLRGGWSLDVPAVAHPVAVPAFRPPLFNPSFAPRPVSFRRASGSGC